MLSIISKVIKIVIGLSTLFGMFIKRKQEKETVIVVNNCECEEPIIIDSSGNVGIGEKSPEKTISYIPSQKQEKEESVELQSPG